MIHNTRQLYTIEEATIHWKNTIQRCKVELGSEIQTNEMIYSKYETNTITR